MSGTRAQEQAFMMECSAQSSHASPFLRWAGSKRQLIPVLSEYWKPTYLRYVEPFAGSAALFFHLAPPKALLADINSELIAAYRQVKSNLPQVLEALNALKKNKTQYLRLRSAMPGTLSPALRAARFIYLNRFCFNGLYRTNRHGQFNVPYSGNKTGGFPSAEQFELCSAKLRKTTLLATAFDRTLQHVREGDFVYMDPPFAVKAKRIFNEYDAACFDETAISKLRDWMITLGSMGISFLVSYADSDEARFLARGFRVRKVFVKRNIAGFAGHRKSDAELLIFN
jgi:DNA adenine methylase